MAEARRAGGTIAFVEPGGPAERAGLRPGHRILSADGHALADVIDWRWHASDRTVLVEVEDAEGAVRTVPLQREAGEWGLDFADALFDGVRECANSCLFCFVAQLPTGLRPSLYVRDDDFRLSFLQGNFVTLTNVGEDDTRRIVSQHLSPLYVSLHAVSPGVRRRLMCPTAEDTALATLERLMRGGIDVHLQIVLVPGVNDGEELDETLSWASRKRRVLSVGVVPMGFTAHQTRLRSSYDRPSAASAVLGRIRSWQAVMRVERGRTWVQAADELYLAAGAPLPPWSEYDGFPQYENGVGPSRAFVDELASSVRDVGPAEEPAGERDVVLVTGTLFAPVLAGALAPIERVGVRAEVLPVRNALFGGNVSVAGLLGRSDIVSAVREHPSAGPFLVPDVVVNSDGLLLDDTAAAGAPSETLSAETGKDVVVVPSEGRAFVERLAGMVGRRLEA